MARKGMPWIRCSNVAMKTIRSGTLLISIVSRVCCHEDGGSQKFNSIPATLNKPGPLQNTVAWMHCCCHGSDKLTCTFCILESVSKVPRSVLKWLLPYNVAHLERTCGREECGGDLHGWMLGDPTTKALRLDWSHWSCWSPNSEVVIPGCELGRGLYWTCIFT